MANTSKSTRSKAEKTDVKEAEVAQEETVAVKKESAVKEKFIPRDIDIHQYIPVHSGVYGKLVYVSPKTGEKFVWESFGEEQDMELQELKNAKGANKKFFEKNWFMFDSEYGWVIDYLGVNAFYKKALNLDNFDELFEKKPEEIEKIISGLSAGQKKSVNYRARQLIAEEQIDSRKTIAALEKALGTELVEK